ncbi:MAG: hypothetical protein GY950_08445, partial [bacterium]|nr:hypothetical protein [bacterium]
DRKPYLTGILVALFILIVYLPALDIYLMRDDFEWLEESYGAWQNPSVLFKLINNFFRPIVKLSFLLNYALFGTAAPLYSLTTILIHLVNVFLLYLFIHRVTQKKHIAALSALTYGVSPLYSEVTLWSAGRPDSILLMFMLGVMLHFTHIEEKEKIPRTRHVLILLLTLSALGTKETWVLLPFFVLSYLWIVKRIPLITAVRKTWSLFLLLALYLGYFIGLPLLSNIAPPTSYADLTIGTVTRKFGYLIFKYTGLGDVFTGAVWQYGLIAVGLAGVTYLCIRRKNWLAIWGLTWMLVSMAISLSIFYAPSRYNYIPLLGFWVMVIAFLSREIEELKKRFNLKPRLIIISVTLLLLFHFGHQVAMLQWEIRDYRTLGALHKQVVEMYRVVKAQLPRGEPIIFVDRSTRKAIDEMVENVQGYRKLLYVRQQAIWQLLYIAPLANFAGNTFNERMVPIPGSELAAVFQGEYTVLEFSGSAFFLSDVHKSQLREMYEKHMELPYKAEAVRFVKTGEQQ